MEDSGRSAGQMWVFVLKTIRSFKAFKQGNELIMYVLQEYHYDSSVDNTSEEGHLKGRERIMWPAIYKMSNVHDIRKHVRLIWQ